MSEPPVILAIDHGTSGIKAALVDVRGRVLDFEFAPTAIDYLPGGGAEQDPEQWWSALVRTSRTLVARGAVERERIEAVCVSSTFSSTVAVGRDGRHLCPALTWMDSRGAPYVRRAMKGVPSIAGYGLGKLLRWLPKTGGGPTLSGKDDVAHALWLRHERPALYRQTAFLLPSKDYLNLRLCGEVAASFDSIMLFWVTDTRNIDRIRYDEDLIRRVGLDRAKLPPLRASTEMLGTVRPEVAAVIGLRPGVKVVMGSADHQSALIGSGAVRDFQGHLYIGTSSWLQCIVPFKKTDVLHSIASLPAAIPGRYQAVNEQDIAGGLLSFVVDNIAYHGGWLLRGERPENPYQVIDQMAAEVPAGSHGLLVTPWLNGERTPVDDEHLRGGLFNVSKTTTADHLARAVLEGVAYNTRWSLGYVERFAGRKLDPLRMIGGGARSKLWCQIFADVLGRTIEQVRDPLQANARGAAFIAAVGLGHARFEDVPELVEIEHRYRPNPAHRPTYDRMFREFVAIYRANRAIYKRLNRR